MESPAETYGGTCGMKTILAVMYRLLQDLLSGVFGKMVIGNSNTGDLMMVVVF